MFLSLFFMMAPGIEKRDGDVAQWQRTELRLWVWFPAQEDQKKKRSGISPSLDILRRDQAGRALDYNPDLSFTEHVTFNKSSSTLWAHLTNQAGLHHLQNSFLLHDGISIFHQKNSYCPDSFSKSLCVNTQHSQTALTNKNECRWLSYQVLH